MKPWQRISIGVGDLIYSLIWNWCSAVPWWWVSERCSDVQSCRKMLTVSLLYDNEKGESQFMGTLFSFFLKFWFNFINVLEELFIFSSISLYLSLFLCVFLLLLLLCDIFLSNRSHLIRSSHSIVRRLHPLVESSGCAQWTDSRQWTRRRYWADVAQSLLYTRPRPFSLFYWHFDRREKLYTRKSWLFSRGSQVSTADGAQ